MIIFKKFLTIFFILGIFSCVCYSQNAAADAARRRQEAENLRQQQERELDARRFNLDNLRRDYGINRTNSERMPLNKSLTLSKKERELRDKFAAPEAEDVALVKEFLKQPRTGIFRLFPDNNCLTNKVVYVEGKCKDVFPGTWLYSFREKDYSDNLVFDLWLKDGRFFTGGFSAQGILVKLGNFSLDNVTLESKGAKFLVEFEFAEKSSEIKKQYEQIGKKIQSDGYTYSRSAEAEVGEVYLMRVVAYRVQKKVLEKILKGGGYKTEFYFQKINRDERKDITIAFRIIKKQANGILTIIWKELDEKDSPEIMFADK